MTKIPTRKTWKLTAVALVCMTLLGGCWRGGKKDPKKSKTQSSDAQRTQTAQRPTRPPDKFETSEDPPLNADTRFAAGQLAESQGDINRAVAQYQEALKLDPNYKNALFRLGAIYTQNRRYNEAIGVWQRYLSATNNSPAAYNNLALAYEQAGKADEAEKAYKAAIEKDPEDSTCRVNYGLMLARRGRLDDAAAQLQTALSPAETQYNIGSVLEQQGKTAEAKARYQKALELDPNLRDARAKLKALEK